MKKGILVILMVMICLTFVACKHTHVWQAANCTSPQICTECGEIEGEGLGHKWIDATCTESRYCSVCGLTSGTALGHSWVEATCTEAEFCEKCSDTQGKPKGHDWVAATCVEAETCFACGETRGDPLGHMVESWEIVVEATCTEVGLESGVCTVCNEACEQEISVEDHTAGEWEVLVQPTQDEDGVRVKKCVVCGAELESEDFDLSEEEVEQLYKNSCQAISYDSLSRTPGEYEGERVKFSGYVVQVCSEAKSILYYSTYRVATYGRYDNIVYIKVDNYDSGSRILEDDYVTFYGEFDGLYTYETVMGSSVTIPCVVVEYID